MITAINWFRSRGWEPFDFQHRCWSAYAQGKSGLIHAVTGIGKTYAAWFGPLIAWMESHGDQQRQAPIQVLWISPLRALAADTCEALRLPVDQLDLPWSVEQRTGDSPASVKRRQRHRLPSALVTTPESVSLMLSYPQARHQFQTLKVVIVDEWHELLGSKRGVLAQLALARLRGWCPDLRIWGLSATLGNTKAAMQVLLGNAADSGILVEGDQPRRIDVRAIIPQQMERFPWAGHLGLKLLPQVIDEIDKAESTLVFTNTRSQTEIWYQAILDKRPDWAGIMALHHGSLDKHTRLAVETMLHDGRLKCVVCTSSLDLGVDFSPVDRVIQIGSPKGIARLMQRAGRSGHRPGRTSRIRCVPTHAFELIEIAAARRSITDGTIEPRLPVTQPVDVLAQHMVSVGLGGGFEADALFDEVKGTHAFSALSRRQFNWILRFVANGGKSLSAYPEYTRLVRQKGRYGLDNKAIARRHRMSIGTITSDAAIAVRFLNGKRLGTIEERFIARLKRGDVFQFAGRALEFVRIKEMTVFVRKANHAKGPAPQWLGGRMPLSSQLSRAVRQLLDPTGRHPCDAPEIQAMQPILQLQARWSKLPRQDEVLIEKLKSREGYHLFVYPFAGLLVNEGLAALLAYRLSTKVPVSFSIAVNDYGFELLADKEIGLDAQECKRWFSTTHLMQDILASLNASEMARRQFREIARVSGLVFQGYPGSQKRTYQIQSSSNLLYSVFKKYDSENLLLKQATREVLDRQLEYGRLKRSLQRISASDLCVMVTNHPTPLAFPIMVNRLRLTLSSEKLADRIAKLQLRLEKAAGGA